MKEIPITFHSMDGFRLEGTLGLPDGSIKYAVLLVHGITVDREEDGFYTEFSRRLDSIDAATFRFDLRCHGSSEGTYEQLTLAGVVNDINSAVQEIRKQISSSIPLSIIAASFGAGLSVYWASEYANEINTLVLLNPLLDYGKRMLFAKPFWDKNRLTDEGAETLEKQGWLPHGEFRMGRALINELLYIKPYEKMSKLELPILTIHGDKDSMVPFDIAQKYATPNNKCSFLPIEGADHGFTHPDDEDFTHPATIQFRNKVFQKVLSWISDHNVK
jgi:uncharacterized protein